MEEIEVGEYVRTKRGIGKILEVKTVKPKMYGKHDLAYLIDTCPKMYITDTEFIKHSKNIIDLIEVGDVLKINDEKYEVIYDESYEKLGILVPNRKQLAIRHSALEFIFNQYKDISIVTKEQFANMQYKVGE